MDNFIVEIPLDISKIPKKELVRVKDDWSDLIIEKVAMKTGEAFLLKRLSKFANTNKGNIAFPNKETLMKSLKITNIKTLNTWLDNLEKIGLIRSIADTGIRNRNRRGIKGRPADVWKVNFAFDLEAYKPPQKAKKVKPSQLPNKTQISDFNENGIKTQISDFNNPIKTQILGDLKEFFTFYPYIDIYLREILEEEEYEILVKPSPLSSHETEDSKTNNLNLFLFCLEKFTYNGEYPLRDLLRNNYFIKNVTEKICKGEVGIGFPINHLTYVLDRQNNRLDWALEHGYKKDSHIETLDHFLESIIDKDFEVQDMGKKVGFKNKALQDRTYSQDFFENRSSKYIQPITRRRLAEKEKVASLSNSSNRYP